MEAIHKTMKQYKIHCPSCQQSYQASAEHTGAQMQCTSCHCYFTVTIESPDSQGAVVAKTHTPIPVSTHSGLNRNVLILGALVILVLGGLGIFFASQKSGDTHNTTNNIRNEILNNSYFTQLIASGVTTREELEKIGEIRPYGEGFIGISSETLSWEQAQQTVKRMGADILAVDQVVDSSSEKMIVWLRENLVLETSSTAWAIQKQAPGILVGEEILAANGSESARKALFHWLGSAGDQKKSSRSVIIPHTSTAKSSEAADSPLRRKLVQSVLSKGGFVKIRKEHRIVDITRIEDLLAGPFELHHVDQVNGDFDDADATLLAHFPELYGIRLHRCSITRLPLEALRELQSIDLSLCQISDESLQPLTKLPKLRRIYLNGGNISRSIVSIIAQCQNLDSLCLRKVGLQDGDLEPLTHLTRLREIVLETNLSDKGLEPLARMPSLEYVELQNLNPGTVTLEPLQGLQVMKFKFWVSTITPSMLENIAKMPNLRSIIIGESKIAEGSLKPLFGMKQLETIQLDKKINNELVDELKKALPNVRITR
jgi:hypothetical protein